MTRSCGCAGAVSVESIEYIYSRAKTTASADLRTKAAALAIWSFSEQNVCAQNETRKREGKREE